VNHDIIK